MNPNKIIVYYLFIFLCACNMKYKMLKKIQKICEPLKNSTENTINHGKIIKSNQLYIKRESPNGQQYIYEVLDLNSDSSVKSITNFLAVYSDFLEPPLREVGLYRNILKIEKCYFKQSTNTCATLPTLNKFYFVVEKPDERNTFQLSQEILRYIKFSNKVYIFEQILSIFRSLFETNNFGIFLDFDQFYIDLTNQKIVINPAVLVTSTNLNIKETIESSNVHILDIDFRLMHPLFRQKLLDKKKVLSREDFEQQDFYNLYLAMIYVYGSDPEQILKSRDCTLQCLHNNKKNSQLYFIRQFIEYRTKEEDIDQDNLLKYLIRLFDIIREKQYQLTYFQCLKLFSIDSFAVEKIELLNCTYQRQFNVNNKRLIWEENGTQMYVSVPTSNMFFIKDVNIVQKFGIKNSPYDKFEQVFKQIEDVKEIKYLLQTRQNVGDKLNKKFNGYKINKIYENCIVNKRFASWHISYSFDNTLVGYLKQKNNISFKTKLDMIIYILELYKSISILNPLDITIEDFVVLHEDLEDITKEVEIMFNPLREAVLYHNFFKKTQFKRLCDQRRVVGVSQLNKYLYSAPESILTCNQEIELKQNKKFASWNMGTIIVRILGVDLQENITIDTIINQLRQQINSHLTLKTSQKLQHLILECYQTIVTKRIDYDKVLPAIIQIRKEYLSGFAVNKKKQIIKNMYQININKKLVLIIFLEKFVIQIIYFFLLILISIFLLDSLKFSNSDKTAIILNIFFRSCFLCLSNIFFKFIFFDFKFVTSSCKYFYHIKS